jgi:hypothetical protein
MNKVIVYTNEQGALSVVHPAPKARQRVLVSEAVLQEVEQEVETFSQEVDQETGVVTHTPRTEMVRRTVEVSPAVYRDQTDEEFLAWCAQRSVPTGLPYQIVDTDAIPQDRTFRNAWKAQGRQIVEDVEKAKVVAKDILRAQRAPLLEALDVQYLRALEQGEDTVLIVAEKQRLRDITKTPDDAKSIDELRAIATTLLAAEESQPA